jgi:hypothetical protein
MQRTCEREHRRTLGERDHHARIPHAMTASFTKSTPDASNASTPRSGGLEEAKARFSEVVDRASRRAGGIAGIAQVEPDDAHGAAAWCRPVRSMSASACRGSAGEPFDASYPSHRSRPARTSDTEVIEYLQITDRRCV